MIFNYRFENIYQAYLKAFNSITNLFIAHYSIIVLGTLLALEQIQWDIHHWDQAITNDSL